MMHRQDGVTLVELLVTLAVIGILVGVVFPGFRGLIDRNGMTTAANSMVLAINYARSEATRGAGDVRVLPRDSSDATNEWGQGWTVERGTGAAAEVLRVFEPIANALAFDGVGGVTELRFNNQGLLADGVGRTLNLCLAGDSGVQVAIAPTGRPSTAELGVGDCP